MSQGEGASKQHEEEGEPVTKAQKQRLRTQTNGGIGKKIGGSNVIRERPQQEAKRRRGEGKFLNGRACKAGPDN